MKKATFEQTCKLKKGARVKMWFAKLDTPQRIAKPPASNTKSLGPPNAKFAAATSLGTWYLGAVVTNLYTPDTQAWECIQVRWDNHEELSHVCPWELELV